MHNHNLNSHIHTTHDCLLTTMKMICGFSYRATLSRPEEALVVTECSIKHDISKHYLPLNHITFSISRISFSKLVWTGISITSLATNYKSKELKEKSNRLWNFIGWWDSWKISTCRISTAQASCWTLFQMQEDQTKETLTEAMEGVKSITKGLSNMSTKFNHWLVQNNQHTLSCIIKYWFIPPACHDGEYIIMLIRQFVETVHEEKVEVYLGDDLNNNI